MSPPPGSLLSVIRPKYLLFLCLFHLGKMSYGFLPWDYRVNLSSLGRKRGIEGCSRNIACAKASTWPYSSV